MSKYVEFLWFSIFWLYKTTFTFKSFKAHINMCKETFLDLHFKCRVARFYYMVGRLTDVLKDVYQFHHHSHIRVFGHVINPPNATWHRSFKSVVQLYVVLFFMSYYTKRNVHLMIFNCKSGLDCGQWAWILSCSNANKSNIFLFFSKKF